VDPSTSSLESAHYCYHFVVQASRVLDSTSRRISFDGYQFYHHHMYDWEAVRNYSCDFAVTPAVLPSVDPQEVDWVSLIVDLSNSVQGLLKHKSLLGVSFQELHKTVEMCANPFQLLRRLRHTPLAAMPLKHLAKRVSNVWLEYNYGWRAFQYDLNNLATDLGKYCGNVSPLLRSRQFSHHNSQSMMTGTKPTPSMSDSAWSEAVQAAGGFSSIDINALCRIVFDAPRQKNVVGCVSHDYIINHASMTASLIHSLGLGTDSLIQTLWEIQPMSFVVDWFVNLNGIMNLPQYLGALNTLNTVNVERLCHSTKVEYTFSAEVAPYHGPWDGSGGNYFASANHAEPFSKPVMVGTKGKVSMYSRRVGIPPATLGVFGQTGLSISQLTTSAALLTKRTRWR